MEVVLEGDVETVLDYYDRMTQYFGLRGKLEAGGMNQML